MASTDSLEDNTAFATKNDASFPILADVEKTLSRDYGVLGASGYAARVNVYIDPKGVVVRVDKGVNPRSAGADLLAALEDLAVPLVSSDSQ